VFIEQLTKVRKSVDFKLDFRLGFELDYSLMSSVTIHKSWTVSEIRSNANIHWYPGIVTTTSNLNSKVVLSGWFHECQCISDNPWTSMDCQVTLKAKLARSEIPISDNLWTSRYSQLQLNWPYQRWRQEERQKIITVLTTLPPGW